MSAPSSTTWPKGISADQYTLEHASHVFYSDAVLLLNPRTILPADLTSRLRALDCNLHRVTSTREFVNGVRSNKILQKPDKPFYNKYMKNMLHVMDLICRLENLRDVEQDMRTRLEGRLGGVRLVRRADEMGGGDVGAGDGGGCAGGVEDDGWKEEGWEGEGEDEGWWG